MSKKIILKLKSINYSGDSIGDDIRLEITIRNKVYSLDKSIKPGSFQEINNEIAQFEISNNLFEEEITIKIIEKDLIFNDTAQITDKIKFNLDSKKSQEFKFEIKVQEMQETFRKATAIFIITISVEQGKRIPTVDDPKWTGNFDDDTEQMILARAIWGEARGASKLVWIGVGCTIRNRLGTKSRTGVRNTYHKIILEKSQFSALWEKPPKDSNLKALRDPLGATKNQADLDKWSEVYIIAGQIISEEIPDSTKGANHYYSKITKNYKAPYWTTKKAFTVKIDNTYFYKL